MARRIKVAYAHPANAAVLQYLQRGWDGTRPENQDAPPEVYDLDHNALGTHPDLAEQLWRNLPKALPVACGWVVYGSPVLVHPASGVIFGFAGGTHTYALRVPPATREAALRRGAKRTRTYSDGTQLSLAEMGEDWIFGGWWKEEPGWCLSAFHHAGSL